MIEIRGRRVDRMQTHVGFGHVARTGQDRVRDKAEMEITPGGIYVKNKEGEWLVPYSNVLWAKLLEDDNERHTAGLEAGTSGATGAAQTAGVRKVQS